jgi:hypothetical protein
LTVSTPPRRTLAALSFETIDFVPLVKAYPALSKTYGEVSCVAGVQMTPDGPEWIRLYPVPFRSLADKQQFRKYQPIRLRVEPHRGDRRRETRRPDRDSIALNGKPIPAGHNWQMRRRFVEPLMAPSMCEIARRQRSDGTSLGVFRPKRVIDIVFEPVDVKASRRQMAKAWADQGSLLDGLGDDEQKQMRELELVPWRFKYHYECDDPECKTHTQSIVDWEIVGTYRRVHRRSDWQERLKAKWLDQLCAPSRDTAFFVGNQHQHLSAFLVLGVWWPERAPEQLALSDLGDV